MNDLFNEYYIESISFSCKRKNRKYSNRKNKTRSARISRPYFNCNLNIDSSLLQDCGIVRKNEEEGYRRSNA